MCTLIYNEEYHIKKHDKEFPPDSSILDKRKLDKKARDKSYKKQKTFIPLVRENIELLAFPEGKTLARVLEDHPKAKDKNYICTYVLLKHIMGYIMLKIGHTWERTFYERALEHYFSEEFFDDQEVPIHMICFTPLDCIKYKQADAFTFMLEQAILEFIKKKKIKPISTKKEIFPRFNNKLIKEILKFVEDNLDSLLNRYNKSG
jgi:hypothetical protein